MKIVSYKVLDLINLKGLEMQQHKQTTNFEEILPNLVLFNLKQLEDIGVLKAPTAKKLIYQGKLEAIKIGAKLHITKAEVIRYLTDRTLQRFGA